MTAELAERARPQAGRSRAGRPEGAPTMRASWTAAAAWAMQEVFLYNIGKGRPGLGRGVLFAPGRRVRNRMGQRENPRQASEQLY